MDAALKEKWTAALRSGKYKQGTKLLRARHIEDDTASYCCLGVLCEIDPGAERVSGGYFVSGVFAQVDLLEKCVGSAHYGIPAWQQTRLVEMNDDEQRPFAEIADYIDANVPAQ